MSTPIQIRATSEGFQTASEELGATILLLPPLSEQRAIADFLDREIKKIDTLVKKIGAAIERLQEYHSALITAAVTGKIDVKEITRTNHSDTRS